MVKSYKKGYRFERSLQHQLYEMGYAVIRAPRSGRIGLPMPDLVAVKDGKVIVLECKSREAAHRIPSEQIEQLQEWERRAGAKAYIVWKIARKHPLFLRLKDVIENGGSVGKKFLLKKGIGIDEI